jgi:hypothetical protein
MQCCAKLEIGRRQPAPHAQVQKHQVQASLYTNTSCAGVLIKNRGDWVWLWSMLATFFSVALFEA